MKYLHVDITSQAHSPTADLIKDSDGEHDDNLSQQTTQINKTGSLL